ncbi:transformation transcription domain-associated -like [Micractinium conductrix]|uniref:Transformation transcription domain-associated -like n=1 Tax=Micractinium conductrix TaxID=554055 RepID=A0A2P6VK25_9CHLO|nr:transformation transcription domain-associated -like [Micractinium conductrix]|eukprot:PSC74456.1 transformation transcription domain-associated -like [Micractinium conductrix]
MVKVASIPGPSLLSEVSEDRMPIYNDFRMAQIKSLAFLTVIARSQNLQPLMQPHKDAICGAIVRVMQTVPDVLSTRKELLIALRNILPTPFRSGLLHKMDVLLDELVLLGASRTCIEGLRPLAYSTLAELVASCKSELSFDQLAKVVHIFTRIAHDCTIPAVLQSTSLRLLYNLIETIFQRRADGRTSELYRGLLSSVLECFVRKLGSLRAQVSRIIKGLEANRASEQDAAYAAADEANRSKPVAAAGCSDEAAVAAVGSSEHKEVFPVLLPALSSGPRDKEVSEFRSLLHTVFSCLKSVLYCMVAFHTNRGLQAPLAFPVKTWSVRIGDVRIVSRLITFGLPALAFYEAVPHPSVDMREQFADLFTVLQDGRDFADVVSPKLPFLFEMASKNRYYFHVIQHLVEGEAAVRAGVNRYMVALLLQFIVAEKKLDALQDGVESGRLVRDMLEMCFSMLPRIQLHDVQKAAQLAQAGIPLAERVLLQQILDVTKALYQGLSWGGAGREACMRLLRSLFYNMALGKFLDVQAAFGVSGLHAKLVDASLDLLRGPAVTPTQEELAAELCLLAPARLEHLIPPMPRMMHAVLRALHGSNQSVSVALKVLDLWVDSFNPEFIERSMAGVIRQLMLSLWGHIQPHPNPHGTKVAEIMGKLGGRSRQWLLEGLSNEYKAIPEYGLRIILAFSLRTSFLVPLDRCVQFAMAAIKQGTSAHQQENAIRLVHVCLATLMKVGLPKAVAMETQVAVSALHESLFSQGPVPAIGSGTWSSQLGVKTRKQHSAEQHMLVSLLLTTMASARREGGGAYAHGVCRHFALLLASGWGAQQAPPLPPSSKYSRYPVLQDDMPAKVTALKHLHPNTVLEAFQEGFALSSAEEREAVLDCLVVFLDTLEAVTSAQGELAAQPLEHPASGATETTLREQAAAPGTDAKAALGRFGAAVTDLAARAIHCCYGGNWPSRLGGVAALHRLVLRLPAAALPRLAPMAAKALFAVLRILPESAGAEEDLSGVLMALLQRCGPGEAVPPAAEAGSEIATARSTTVSDLLKPIMKAFDSILERRLLPIRSITAQSNHAHSVSFILRTCAPELALRSEPIIYITEACTAMEMSDAAIGATASFRGAPVRTEAIVRLRTACLQVLTAAIGWQGFREAEAVPARVDTPPDATGDNAINLVKLRERLLKVLIMELGSQHDAIIAVAKKGVLLALEHNMLPKPILQEALRPILTDLAFYNCINLRLLRHLHRLLDLLSGQFNVTLGDKLSEHLKKWIDVSNVLQPPQPVSWAQGTEWEVAAGMLNIFHKLPSQAKKFLETQGERPGIVVLTIGLEESLPKLPGPVIPSKLCVAYFVDSTSRLANDCYFLRLLDIVRRPEGATLLKALSEAEGQLAAVFTPKADADAKATASAQLNCVHLVHTMAKLLPGWLPQPLFNVALQRWRSADLKARLASASFLPLPQRLESKWLAKIMLHYVEHHHDAFAALLDMMVVFSSPMAVDFTFLKSFISRVVTQNFSVDRKREVIKHWLDAYRGQDLDQDQSVNVLRHLINPLISWVVQHDESEVLSTEVVQSLVADVFQNPEKGGPSEQIQMELVQLCTTLIQHAHPLFQEHRKELIQFGWWTLKYDNIAKPYAFLCVAHFFKAFPTPEKIMLQVYVALCRLSQNSEAAPKDAVRKGIDIMIPNLARAAAADAPVIGPVLVDTGDSVMSKDSTASGAAASGAACGVVGGGASVPSAAPSYARYLKRVLSEDGHMSVTLVHLLQVIVRNRDMFFQSRVLFMTTMLNVMTRLGLPGNSTLENRYLSVDVASTVFYWDHLATQETVQSGGESAGQPTKGEAATAQVKPEPMEAIMMVPPSDSAAAQQQPATSAQPGSEAEQASRMDPSRLTPGTTEMIVNFLLRMAFVSCDPRDRDEAGWRRLHKHCMKIIADAARLCKACTLKLHYFEKFLAQNLQHQAGAVQQGQQAMQEPVAALMTGLHIAEIYMEHQPETFIECCAMQLAIMLEPALVSPSPAPVRLLSSIVRRLVSLFPPTAAPLEQPKTPAADLAGKLQLRLQEYINRRR